MIWGVMTSAGVGPLCFIKSKVNSAIYQEILVHFMLQSADKLYGRGSQSLHSKVHIWIFISVKGPDRNNWLLLVVGRYRR